MNFDAVSEAFARATELEGDERADFLRGLRQREPEIAKEVESLLGYHGDGETDDGDDETPAKPSLLDRPAIVLLGTSLLPGDDSSPIPDEPSLPPGTLLLTEGVSAESPEGATWAYRVIRELGRGGMGVVYEAEQAFPARRVALKLLRGGAGKGTTVPSRGGRTVSGGVASNAARRLMLEAEALGALHHPGIAHVHAAGTLRLVREGALAATSEATDRWLYISMELVEGPPLNVWAKERTTLEKIETVAELCDAVEHAHQRGVVHRDLKPGNVLVELGSSSDSKPGSVPPVIGQPKVLDFGVARITKRSRPKDATLSIGQGQLIGTLRYMSPEQARGTGDGRVIDSRSDVYALGAILYELVAGTPPIPVDDASIVGAVERIVSQQPARPSGIAPLIGKRRAADLETVLFKALAKEPADRYQHAGDLGADLRRILADEPITARPPTVGEQVMRLVRRNRVAAGAIAAGLVLLVAGAGVATWQAVRATRALERVNEEAAVTRSSLHFMERMISSASPEETRGQDVTVREMLQAAVIEARTMPDNRATATACRLLAEALQEIGELGASEPLARRALSINRAELGDENIDTIESGILSCRIGAERGRQEEALTEARNWREIAVRTLGPDHRVSLRTAMAVEYALNPDVPEQLKESEALLKETIARMKRVYGPSDRRTYSAMSDLCALYLNSQRIELALPVAQEVYDGRVRLLGEDHPETIVAMGNLTAALANQGRMDKALELNAKNVELAVRVLGVDHPSTQYARSNRAQLLMRQNRLKDAETEAKAVWEARARRLGPDTRLTMTARGLYIACVLGQADFDKSEPLIREYIARNEALFGPDDSDTLQAVTLLYDWAEGKGDKATLEAVTRRLAGTKYDPAKAVQQPPIGSEKKPESP